MNIIDFSNEGCFNWLYSKTDMKQITNAIIVGIIIALLTCIINAVPAYVKMSYTVFLTFSSAFSIVVLAFLAVYGYRIGKSYKKRYALYSGLIIGLLVGITSGAITPYLQSHSLLYKEMINAFIARVAGSKISITQSFNVSSYIGGAFVTAIFYSIVMTLGSFFGGIKKADEQNI